MYAIRSYYASQTLLNGDSVIVKGAADDNNSIKAITISYAGNNYNITNNLYNWSHEVDLSSLLIPVYLSTGEDWSIGGETVNIDRNNFV